ncbi:PREDICTED: protein DETOXIFICATION 12 [Prunus mume]|uniref:Protein DETOXIFICATION n=1 Tax=Prunus mume TaxID=102107 RepID=A0ABM0NSR9_PRUMU|nr:PREDICTED: protein DETOXIFICATION 12 [Prunus mume]
MEEALLERRKELTWGSALVEELKKVMKMAAPMVVVTLSQYLLQVISMMMVGHLGELSLSGVAIATSFSIVTGFSLLSGMAGGLETLCGQAYGAKQYQQLGTYTYCAIISLTLVCLPVSLLWIFMEKLLILLGQDPLIAQEAGRYAIWLIPSLFAYAVLQSLVRFFLAQGLIFPMLLSSSLVLLLHIPLCWALVFHLGLGNIGAALSTGLCNWLNTIILLTYLKYSSTCEKTRVHFSTDVFLSIKKFFVLAIPSAVMVCLEWWSFELLILLSGLLPNSKLETSVLSICLTTTSLHYFIPYSVGAAASNRISNELGAHNPHVARVVVWAAMVLAVTEAVIVSTILLCCCSVWGYVYSNDMEVVNYVKRLAPLLSLSLFADSLQAVLSGVARGCGMQRIGAYINLGAYYIAGIPVAVVLGFLLHLRGTGLWIGMMTGSSVQALLFILITSFINWPKQATKARERIFKDSCAGNVLD